MTEQASQNGGIPQDPRTKMCGELAGILSRCGVPLKEYRFNEFRDDRLDISVSITFSFDNHTTDNPLPAGTPSDSLLGDQAMAAFTKEAGAHMRRASRAKVAAYIEGLKERNIRELIELTRNPVTFDSQRACGRIWSTSANGKTYELLERTIAFKSSGLVDIKVNLANQHLSSLPPLRLDDDVMQEIALETPLKIVKADYYGSSGDFRFDFEGSLPCYRQAVWLNGAPSVYCYSVCGAEFKVLEKPYFLDLLFDGELRTVEELLKPENQDDLKAKAACALQLSGKPMLARALRQVEATAETVGLQTASALGIAPALLMAEPTAQDSAMVTAARRRWREKQADALADLLIKDANGFVSRTFATRMARNLIRLVPHFKRVNANTDVIWMLISAMVWVAVFGLLFLIPKNYMLGVCFMGSVISAVIITKFMTCNMDYYTAVRRLKLKSGGHSVPRVEPEAINILRHIGVTLLIEIIMKVVWIH